MDKARNSNLWGGITILMIICCCSLTAQAKYGGGTGEPNDPYLIYDANQMNAIGAEPNDWDKHFKLMANINMSVVSGRDYNPIGEYDSSSDLLAFRGVFDGDGHSISNLRVVGDDIIGLFGCVNGLGAKIRNVHLVGVNINAGATDVAGSLIGYLSRGQVTDCSVEGGSVSGVDAVGGLIGSCYQGYVSSCSASVNVHGDERVGGLVGVNTKGQISDSSANGNISGTSDVGGLVGNMGGYNMNGKVSRCFSGGIVSGDENVGGLVGYSRQSSVTDSHSTCNVTAAVSSAGGLVGYNYMASVGNCHASGQVSGGDNVGGLVGEQEWGSVASCYASGRALGALRTGGLVGLNNRGAVRRCYASGMVQGTICVGGLVGDNQYRSSPTDSKIEESFALGYVSGHTYVGGLVGYNGCRVYNSYATGEVHGTEAVGGLAGYIHNRIENCYSTGKVVGLSAKVGGLAGDARGISWNCFWDIETSSRTSSATGKPRTTAQMQHAMTFAGWGCELVWTIDEGNDYPHLAWEEAEGELITKLTYGGGTGEADDPYLIYTAEQLNAIGLVLCDVDKHFKLMADIDLADYDGLEGRLAFNIIGISHDLYNERPFEGSFDGNRHTVSNLTIHDSPEKYVGLFGYVQETSDSSAEIRDIGLIDPDISDADASAVGALVGSLRFATLRNCFVKEGEVTGNDNLGGLVGYNGYKGSIHESYSECVVRGNENVGGLSGQNWRAAQISDSYSCSLIEGNQYVGGLVGLNEEGTIGNCYSAGVVQGTRYVGGFAGINRSGTINNSLWDVEASGQSHMCGTPTNCDNTCGRTTDQMQRLSTFTEAGWDLVAENTNGTDDIWSICEGIGYPQLTSQFVIGDFDGDHDTDSADFCIFAERWLQADGSFWCGIGCDLTNDGDVGYDDLKEWAENWMAGVE